jgi:hypothetical protein
MYVSEAQEARHFPDENTRMRKLGADLSLDEEAMQSVSRDAGLRPDFLQLIGLVYCRRLEFRLNPLEGRFSRAKTSRHLLLIHDLIRPPTCKRRCIESKRRNRNSNVKTFAGNAFDPDVIASTEE